jgi:ornithine cyclodeaminase/alanine dehydrogenase-like protein (mu-crystallin family)
MTGLPYLDADAVRALLPVAEAIDVVEAGFAAAGAVEDPLRSVVDVAAGQLLLMPSQSAEAVGVKVVSIGVENPARGLPRIQGVYVLMDAETLTPQALLDASALTALRTPAVSAVASRRLAIPDARVLVVIGAGPQAEAHVHALRAVRPIDTVRILSRTPQSAARLATRLHETGIDVAPGSPEDLGRADIVCACTTARTPVVEARWLAAHAHVNAIGSHEPDVREVDTDVVARAQVAVETRAAALAEAGDLLVPLAAGEVDEAVIRWDLAELVRGEGPAPDPGTLSLFKSVGIAFEDLLVADAVVRRSRADL